jgi:nitric oxide reductase large subunit
MGSDSINVNENSYMDYLNYLENERSGSVFSKALPYAASFIALGALGTYGAVVFSAQHATALTVASVATALFGCYGFLTTAIVGVSSNSVREFNQTIKKAITITFVSVVTELAASVAKTIFIELIQSSFLKRDR